MIVVNVFAIVSAILFYLKKIRPEPFLLGSVIWLLLMVSVWYIMPYIIYKKNKVFKDSFIIYFNDNNIILENERGQLEWKWQQFYSSLETPNFFHLYFSPTSFFIVPKQGMDDDFKSDVRKMLHERIGKR